MTKELDGEEIHSGSKLFVLILAAVELGRGGERVDENESRFGWIVRKRHLIAGGDATQVRDVNGSCRRHGAVRFSWFLLIEGIFSLTFMAICLHFCMLSAPSLPPRTDAGIVPYHRASPRRLACAGPCGDIAGFASWL